MGGGTRPTRVSLNVAVCGHKEIHVNAVSEVAQLVKFVDGDVLQVGHLKSKEDQEVNSQNYGGHFNFKDMFMRNTPFTFEKTQDVDKMF